MKIKSQLYDQASGSIGNLTAANGAGGLYFKQKPNPTNPNTTKQQAVRASLALANTTWGSMTQANRDKWAAWGSELTHKNSIGNDVTVSGWSAFAGAFVLLNQAGKSTAGLKTAAPSTKGYASSAAFTAKISAGKIVIETEDTATRTISVFVSGAERQTINNYGGKFNYETNAICKKNTDIALTDAIVTGKRYFIRVQVIELDGRYSKPSVIQVNT